MLFLQMFCVQAAILSSQLVCIEYLIRRKYLNVNSLVYFEGWENTMLHIALYLENLDFVKILAKQPEISFDIPNTNEDITARELVDFMPDDIRRYLKPRMKSPDQHVDFLATFGVLAIALGLFSLNRYH